MLGALHESLHIYRILLHFAGQKFMGVVSLCGVEGAPFSEQHHCFFDLPSRLERLSVASREVDHGTRKEIPMDKEQTYMFQTKSI